MKLTLQPKVRLPRLRPLVAGLALATIAALPMYGHARVHDQSATTTAWPVALAYLQASAQTLPTTVKVLNCDDSGAGSLREAYAGAVENTFIDMRDLQCSKITLTSGALTDTAIAGAHYGVVIQGGGQIIDGGGLDRVLIDRSPGLALQNLTITNGSYAGNARGGCIYATGEVQLAGKVIVSSCQLTALGNDQDAMGGAIYSHSGFLMSGGSLITGSTATSISGRAFGGAIWARKASIQESTVSGNTADGSGGSFGGAVSVQADSRDRFPVVVEGSTISNNHATNYFSFGGGIYVDGVIGVGDSTISGNQAQFGGGVFASNRASTYANYFTQVTISGNSASSGGGMLLEHVAQLYNCTITKNSASLETGGLQILAPATLNSTIVAGNVSEVSPASADVGGTDSSLSGAHNLIIASVLQAPADTITQDPLLGPLQNNGGSTQTHALIAGSPAIDMGSNILVGVTNDQRGTPYPRVAGRSADIGAFEYVPPEHIFADNFDLRPGERLFLNGFE